MTRLLALIALLTFAQPGIAQTRQTIDANFQTWLTTTIWPRAQANGVSAQTFQNAFNSVTIDYDLPDLRIPDARPQTQAEFRPPANYFAPNVVNGAASTGRNLLTQYQPTLDQITRQTGVPARIILAIWGRESSYGQAAIPHDAFRILATKGFLSTRADYFTDELIAALQILERGHATREQMKSSWAGALGQPQFMPSNFLAYAADGNGDGRADIWTSAPDTLASIGAYLQHHGWDGTRDWGFEITLPPALSCALEGPDNRKSIADWTALGVTRASGRPFPASERSKHASLLLPAGRYGPAFLVTPNFYVLKDYNESDAYALFVGHVGDKIQYGTGPFQTGWANLSGLSRTTIQTLQQGLVAQGFDVGGADGLIGFKTRRSIGAWQAQNGMTPTCYPDRSLTARN